MGAVSKDYVQGAHPLTGAEAHSHIWHVFRTGVSFLLLHYTDLLPDQISPPKC